jgi:hypothetical protein
MTEGLVVSEPRGDSAPYDRIVERNNKLYKVQIKMRSSHGKAKLKNYIVTVSRADGQPYTREEVDVVAIHLRNENLWYFIPIQFVSKKMRINPNKDKFDKYKYNWNVFK